MGPDQRPLLAGRHSSIERVIDGVAPEDRRKLLYENALRVYGIETVAAVKID